MKVNRANPGAPGAPAPKKDFADVLLKLLRPAVGPRLADLHGQVRGERVAIQERREGVVRNAERIGERRESIERHGDEQALVRDRDGAGREPKSAAQTISTAVAPSVGPAPSAAGAPEPARADRAAAIEALVERIAIYQRAGGPALEIAFRERGREVASVVVTRTARGEVSLRLTPAAGASRASVLARAGELRHRLTERGLRVGALVVA